MVLTPNFWSLIDFLHAFLTEVDFLWATLLEPKSQTQNSHHQANLYFLKPNYLYFHVGYAAKTKAIPPIT